MDNKTYLKSNTKDKKQFMNFLINKVNRLVAKHKYLEHNNNKSKI